MRALLLALLLTVPLCATPALADDNDDREDLYRLEQARQRGEILPLTELLARLSIDGEVIEIEVDDDDGRIIYEIYYLDRDGRRHEIEVDAATAEIIDDERHGSGRGRNGNDDGDDDGDD